MEFNLDKFQLISLDICDLASLSAEGKVEVGTDQKLPTKSLEGEKVRYELVFNKAIASRETYKNGISIMLDNEILPIITDITPTSWKAVYPFFRTKRLREPYAQEVLRSMCQMVGRPGFEYPIADLSEIKKPVKVPTSILKPARK
jgi:hypothetical protein